MATIADSLRGLANDIRAIPGQFGIRPYTISVTTRTRSGTYGLQGGAANSTTAITEADGQPPKVRWLNDEEIALGSLPRGAVRVGPITPSHTGGGGADFATITGQDNDETEILYYTLTGPDFPNGAKYKLSQAHSDRALHYTLVLTPVEPGQH
jgi:hypothetical protein